MSIIKAYQSETAIPHFSSQNSPSCCTPGCLFTKNRVCFWLVAVMFVYIHMKCLRAI